MPHYPANLESYLPAYTLRRVAADPSPLTGATADRFPAAVLFADIAGFTALTERFAEQGPSGTEEFTALLNAYMDRLITLTTGHGGDVVKFAGDALVTLFPAEGGNLTVAIRRAAQCALQVMSALHDHPVAPDVRMRLKIGIGAGEVLAMYVGGVHGRWELLIAGDAVRDAGAAEARCQPGEVAMAPAAWKLVHAVAAGEALWAGDESGCVRLAAIHDRPAPLRLVDPILPPDTGAALAAYIPHDSLGRLLAGQSGWVAELRRVSVLFVRLPDPEGTWPGGFFGAQAVMEALQTALYRFEGSVNKLTVDEKGISLMAVLGLPPLAHEDDAIRAVRAAMAIRAGLSALGVGSDIGVTTGSAFCGFVGNDRRREYTVMGASVNMAARLMQAADGGILCDTDTQRAAWAGVNFDRLPDIHVKGKAEPVAVYNPRSTVQKRTDFRSLIGRVQERARLTECLASLRTGTGCTVVVEGEAGIGKSRLLAFLRQEGQAAGVTLLAGFGDATEQTTAYHAWRGLFQALLQVEEQLPPAARREQVEQQLQSLPDLSHLAPLLGAVLGLDWPDNDFTAQLTGTARADNSHQLLVRLLQQAAVDFQRRSRPLVLLLEDAHWLDSASWAMVRLVCNQVRPLLLVVATRPIPDTPPEEYTQLRQDPETAWLRLEALGTDETLALVCDRLGVRGLPPAVAELIHGRAGGNPFFTEELVDALCDAGLIILADGECRMAPGAGDLGSLALPGTLQGVITTRIDRLPPIQQLTLKVGSVIGRVFAFRTLRDAFPVEAGRDHLPDSLARLAELDLTRLAQPEPDLAHMFKHVITQEVAYNLMLFAQRRELHKAVALWYERTYVADLAPYYPLLAHHWCNADVTDKAIDYLEKAGDQALIRGVYREAVRFFDDALALNPERGQGSDLVRRGHWEQQLGVAFMGLGRPVEARRHLERGLALTGRPVPAGGAFAWQFLVQVLRQILNQVGFRPRQEAPLAIRARLLAAARASELLQEVSYFERDSLRTLYFCFQNLNLAEAAGGPSPNLISGYGSMAIGAGLVPVHTVARYYVRRVHTLAPYVTDILNVAWAYLCTGLYLYGIGELAAALADLEQAAGIYARLGHRSLLESRGLVCGIRYTRGEMQGVRSVMEELEAKARADDNLKYLVIALCFTSFYDMTVGRDAGEIAPQAEEAVQLTQAAGGAVEPFAHGILALVRLRQGQAAAALALADKAASQIAGVPITEAHGVQWFVSVAEVYLTLWEKGKGRSAADEQRLKHSAAAACAWLNKGARIFPVAQPPALLHQGQYDWLAGRPSRAWQAWRRSLAVAERLGIPLNVGQAHFEMGRHLPDQDPRRREHLTQACTIFARLGAHHYLAAAEGALSGKASDRATSL